MVESKRTREVCVTVRLSRGSWPREFRLPVHQTGTSISLLRGRLTGREAVVVIRVEGALHEVQEALRYWKYCGFTVEEGDHGGIRTPARYPGNRQGSPSFLLGRGSRIGSSLDLLPEASEPRT